MHGKLTGFQWRELLDIRRFQLYALPKKTELDGIGLWPYDIKKIIFFFFYVRVFQYDTVMP